MPTTFNFYNSAAGPVQGTGTLWTTTSPGNGVNFTLSDIDPGSFSVGFFGNSSLPGNPLQITANAQTDFFTLKLSHPTLPSLTQFSGTAANKVVLDLGRPTAHATSFFGHWSIFFMNGNSTVHAVTSVTANQNVSAVGQFTGVRFGVSSAGGGAIVAKSITVNNLNCFCTGTLIDTPSGKRPVEELTAGDVVLTAEGKETTVHWLGQQFVDTKLRHPKMVNPICITAGALGGGLPERDLFLSQDHAVAIDGTLYNAGALVNGETIYQVAEMPLDGFTYYHVETDAHELLVAEGVAAESYIDYAGRDGFDNAEAGTGREITEMDLPRVSTSRMVPESLKPRKVA